MNVIAADIGNSTITIGICKGKGIDVYRMPTHPVASPDEYLGKFSGFMDISNVAGVEDGVICSVVSDITPVIAEAMEELTDRKPLVISNDMALGIKLDIENPETLGTDRVAGVVGALTLADPPLAVLDFGTATTANFIEAGPDGTAVFSGGAIMPGLALMGQALESNTAQLPRVAHNDIVRLPGRNTPESILAGITYATAGGMERIIEEMEQVTGSKYRVLVTGGMLEYAAAFIRRPTKRDPALTLRGLLSIQGRTRGY